MHEIPRNILLAAIDKQKHTVITGLPGIGKSKFLNGTSNDISSNLVTVQLLPGTDRPTLLKAVEQLPNKTGIKLQVSSLPPKVASKARMGPRLTWDDIRKSISRFTVDDLLSTIIRTIEPHQCVVFVDSLEVPPSYFDALEQLAEHATIVAVAFVAKFPVKIELKPLPLNESE